MSDRTELAEHVTGLGVIGLATMGVNAAPLLPLAVLTAWGIDRFRSCSMRRQRTTIDSLVREIEKSGADHRSVGPALALLKENRHKVAIPPTVLADAEKRGNFPATLYDVVFAGVDVPKDDGVEDLIRLVLASAWQELRKDEDYHKIFVQEGVAALERDMADGFSRIDGKLGSIKSDTEALREGQDAQTAMLQELLRRTGGMTAAVEQADSLSVEDLKVLAAAFEETSLDAKPALVDFLTKKGEEYRALRDEVDAIDDGLKRLSNLKAAARDAIERVDLDEVEELLSRVQEVELEEAARTAELRANNALLRGRVDQGYRLLSAAADSFAAIDPLEPARRRIRPYWAILWKHGARYGGTGLRLSLDLLAPVLGDELMAQDPELWAAGQNNLGNALQVQGTRTGGEDGTRLLAEAVEAYRAALTIRTEGDHPVDWATTQNNLGGALDEQGTRTGGNDGTRLLAEAVGAYRAALTIRTQDDHPVHWATTQNNLGGALQEQGTRTGGEDGTRLLAEAVGAYRAALTIRTQDDHPVDWATTQNNLGNALLEQGTRTGGDDGTRTLAEAVGAYRAALTIFTEGDHPVHWATTQNNLGAALRQQGARTAGDDGTRLLAEAVEAYRAALTIRTRDDHPVGWARTQENLALAEQAIAGHEATADPRPHLEAALVHVEAALTVYDPKHMRYDYGTAIRLRDDIRTALAALDNP